MGKQFVRALTMITLLIVMSLAAAVVSANGQASMRMMANVPFDFVVGDSELVAGRYQIETATAAGDALKIKGSEKAVFRLVANVQQLQPTDRSKLVFHRYGNRYFLAEIWVGGARGGRRLLKSRNEKALERELASITKPGVQMVERVEIALMRD